MAIMRMIMVIILKSINIIDNENGKNEGIQQGNRNDYDFDDNDRNILVIGR